jgi:hypothetical protein
MLCLDGIDQQLATKRLIDWLVEEEEESIGIGHIAFGENGCASRECQMYLVGHSITTNVQ